MEAKEILQNEPETIQFRRNSKTLVILGTGVMVFAFWTIVKIAAYLILGVPIVDEEELGETDELFLIIFYVILVVVLLGDVIIRLIVGLCLRSEGLGKRVKSGYLVLNVWLILFGVVSLWLEIEDLMMLNDTFMDEYITLFMELSSFLILIEAFIAAIGARRYKSRKVRAM